MNVNINKKQLDKTMIFLKFNFNYYINSFGIFILYVYNIHKYHNITYYYDSSKQFQQYFFFQLSTFKYHSLIKFHIIIL